MVFAVRLYFAFLLATKFLRVLSCPLKRPSPTLIYIEASRDQLSSLKCLKTGRVETFSA